jgi:hypothetical protein
MPIPPGEPQNRLHGVSIFLSASVPSKERAQEYGQGPAQRYERIPEAPLRIEEAVASIARAIFVEGGTLVFGAHPSISPLVARVVDHYYLPTPAKGRERTEPEIRWKNPSVIIYQTRVWEPYWADTTKQLASHPLVDIQWTPIVGDESVDPAIKDRPQAPLSSKLMRETMLKETSPVAMIAVGGMKGILDEAGIFADWCPGRPIFTLATTGGAAAILAGRRDQMPWIRVADDEAQALVRTFWQSQAAAQAGESWGQETQRPIFVPYAVVAQQIVANIIAAPGMERST